MFGRWQSPLPCGPQVLPGIYTVKLTVGDKIQEKRVEVRVDPTVKISPAELQAQLDLALKLRDLVSPVNDGLRVLDSIKQQVEQIERVGKDRLGEMPADVTKELDNYKKKLTDLSKEFAVDPEESIGGSQKFADLLNGLYQNISGGNFAPTATMRENFEILKTESPGKIAQINKFITGDTAEINKTLQKSGLAIIITGKPIEQVK